MGLGFGIQNVDHIQTVFHSGSLYSSGLEIGRYECVVVVWMMMI